MNKVAGMGLLIGLPGIALGLLVGVGPGERLHHDIHKKNIEPYFRECCCANEDHTQCAWPEHFGKPWRDHHPGISRLGFMFAGGSLIFTAACWATRKATPSKPNA